MFTEIKNFKTFPESVKMAFISTFVGWILFYSFYFFYMIGQAEFSKRQLSAGIVCCVCLLMFRNWTRVLCMLANIMFLIQFIPLIIVFFQAKNYGIALFIGAMVGMFTVSTYFLFIKETADFFKSFTKTTNDSDDELFMPAERALPKKKSNPKTKKK